MIHRLRGTLVEKDTEGVVIDVGGVGYRSSASLATLRALPSLGEECVIHTRMVVLELKGKSLAAFGPEPVVTGGGGGGPYVEARDALTALGYRLEEAEKALNDVPPQDSVEKYIKEALRRIGSRR